MRRVTTRTARGIPVALAGIVLLAGCTNAPPPPLVSSTVATTKPAKEPETKQAVVGVDSIKGGYNPHARADLSTVTTALSQLLLPSVFRPGPDGALRLDRSVMVSARVTDAKPFTVTYRVRDDASWSDGAPIGVGDFAYLRDAMATQPGVTNPAGYRLIKNITGRENGKLVRVSFAESFPGWRTLFQNLLPAHLLKDAPGGWHAALQDSFPVVAGPFGVRSLDTGRGEIVLQRNDRYWGRPAKLDRIVLRTASRDGIVRALRTGDDQLASFAVDERTLGKLEKLGKHVRLSSEPRQKVVRMLLRPASSPLDDDSVRKAVAAALDRDALIKAGTKDAVGSLRADALARAPSQPEYEPTIPDDAPIAAPDPDTVRSLLTDAGYTRSGGEWRNDGKPLTLTIAAPKGRERLVALAEAAREQLEDSGITVKVHTQKPDKLYGTSLAGDKGGPDIAVTGGAVLADGAAELAAEFGCPTTHAKGAAPPPPPSPSGFCDSSVQHTILSALTGEEPLAGALAELEPELWRRSVVIPLFQPADEVAVREDVSGVRAGPPLLGPFPSAPTWVNDQH